MNEVTLPASPNWYLSKVLACSQNGVIAWGSRNNIVIARRLQDSKTLQYSMISNAHTDKVNFLAFSPAFGKPNKNLLISAGNEHIARVWDLDSLSAIKSYSYADEKQIVVAADWSNNPDIVCILSTDGFLVSWNLSLDINTQISLGKVTATCLSCCPHDTHLAAVGTKNGLVYIVNTAANTKGAVMYKLRGHDIEIISLSWCPVDTNVINGTDNKDLLLASGGKDRSVFIWRAGGDGRYETAITLPVNPLDSHQHRTKLNSAIGNWTTVCWLRPTLLLATSSWGELISCELSFHSAKNKPTWKLVHGCHGRGLFCISPVPKSTENSIENWREDSVDTIWTTGQDRQVVCCKLIGQSVEIEYTVPTQGGYVYCITTCPLETSRIAFGVGDAMLRLWNLSEPHENSFDITMIWQKIQGQVRTISWHPEKENILAYATGDGRVGVVDTNEKKLPTLLRQYHRNTVYNLGWGIDPHSKKYALFSCAEGELVYYNVDQPSQVPSNIFKKQCTSFAWKPDLSCLVAGLGNGSIVVFDKNIVERHRSVYAVKKDIICLLWHPDSTATDLSLSPLRNYLAVAADTTAVIIFDLSDICKKLGEAQEHGTGNEVVETQSMLKVVATLSGHTEKVVCLAWSPHFSGRLVSASYDGTAQVWNVETQQLMGTFMGHSGALLSCIWSPLDPDLIMTGGTDFTIHVWRLSQQAPIIPKGKFSAKTSRWKKSKQKEQKNQSKESNAALKSNSNKVENGTCQSGASNDDKFAMDETASKEATGKLPSKKSASSGNSAAKSERSLLLDSIRNLIKRAQGEGTDSQNIENGDPTPPTISDNEDFSALLAARKSNYAAQGMHNLVTEVDVWSNNLKENLDEAVKQKRLNDFLVSLAPSLSTKTWMEMCDAYAIQLISEGNPRKAVSYLLCVHKIPQAVQVFINANMYNEAYALARCKLDPEDKLIETVLKHWAEYASKRDFEQAAQCYARLGEFSMAAKILARRDDTQCLQITAELASVAGDPDFCQSLAERAVVKAMSGFDYSTAHSVVDKFPSISYRKVHISVLQEVKKAVKKEGKLNTVPSWVKGESSYGLFQELHDAYKDCETYYNDLCQKNITFNPENEPKLWINVSYNIAMALTCHKEEKRMQHVVSALDSISQFETRHLNLGEHKGKFLIDVLSHLDMRSPMDNGSIYAKKDFPVSKSLRAYLCVGLLNWLVDTLKNSEAESDIRPIVQLVQILLEDVLDRETIKFWSMAQEINKLEAKVTSALGPLHNTNDEGDTKEDITALLTKLDETKNNQKRFIEERISVPCPIVAYTVANELIDTINDEAIKTEFTKVLEEKWTSAIL